jgi:predicted HTH domain antitoxin
MSLSLHGNIIYITDMKTLTINIPNTADIDDREARMSLASKLYERGKLTLGQAAELAGYTKETFMELLAEYNVPLISYPADELDDDIENARNHSI